MTILEEPTAIEALAAAARERAGLADEIGTHLVQAAGASAPAWQGSGGDAWRADTFGEGARFQAGGSRLHGLADQLEGLAQYIWTLIHDIEARRERAERLEAATLGAANVPHFPPRDTQWLEVDV